LQLNPRPDPAAGHFLDPEGHFFVVAPPTCPPPAKQKFVYHCGKLLQNPQVQTVFFGDGWKNASNSDYMSKLNNGVDNIVSGPYLAALLQYGVGAGTRDSSAVLPQSLPTDNPILVSNLEKALADAIDKGDLKPNGNNRLYVVFLPPGVTITDDTHPSEFDRPITYGPKPHGDGFTGFHQSYNGIPYAVVTSAGSTSNDLDNATANASHEIAEAATNPTGLGWYQDKPFAEIGDLTDGSPGHSNLMARLKNGTKVQLLQGQDGNTIYPDGTK
jgi:hypothetical protein